MSRLEELIQKLCPNGVEYKTLVEVCNFKYGKGNTIPDIEGEYPVYGCNGIVGSTNEFNNEDAPIIGHIGSAGIVNWGEGKHFVTYNGTMCKVKQELMTSRYLYHLLCVMNLPQYVKGSQPFLSYGDFSKVKIPVPPLEVQREIVRILDSFTELTAELIAKLTAELTARKKQYEFYRDDLLKFDNEVEFKSFRELFDVRNGLNKGKEFFGHGSPIINFTDVYTNRWLVKDSFIGTVEVTPDEIERYSAKKGDVFFTRTSETKEDIGMASTLIEDVENCVFSGFVLRARPKTDLLLPKFCAYYFSSTAVRNTIVRYASFTTRATTTGDKLSKILVPILSKEKQEKIVYVLDNFDAICSDLNIGLPAEIEARQKQYEFYRDALLTYAATGKIIDQTDRQTDLSLIHI